MLREEPFNFHTIQKITETFGFLFGDITIERIDPKTSAVKRIKVPISQSAKEKWAVRMEADPNAGDESNQRHVQIILPRMGFDLTNFHFDAKRKLPTINYRVSPSGNGPSALVQLTPLPWIFDYSLYLQARTLSDSYAIVEQILAFFRPDYTVPIIDIPPMNSHRDIVFTLLNCSHSDSYEGNFQDKRVIEWQFDFQAQAYIYPPIKIKPVITQVIVGLEDSGDDNFSGEVIVAANPNTGNIDQPYSIIVTDVEQP
jgi:hypothetical protein